MPARRHVAEAGEAAAVAAVADDAVRPVLANRLAVAKEMRNLAEQPVERSRRNVRRKPRKAAAEKAVDGEAKAHRRRPRIWPRAAPLAKKCASGDFRSR